MGFSIKMLVLYGDIGPLKGVGETPAVVSQGIPLGGNEQRSRKSRAASSGVPETSAQRDGSAGARPSR